MPLDPLNFPTLLAVVVGKLIADIAPQRRKQPGSTNKGAQ